MDRKSPHSRNHESSLDRIRLPKLAQSRLEKRPVLELLSLDVALENWSEGEREEFERTFSRRFRRSFSGFDKEKPRHWQFFCPLCGCTRRLSAKPTPWTLLNVLRVALTAGVATLGLWPWLEWKGIICFIPLWVTFELVFRIRMRAQLICDQCGFDPTLYLTDIGKARREVESFWEQKLRTSAPRQGGAGKNPGTEQAAQAAFSASDTDWAEQDAAGRKDPLRQGETLLDRG